MGGGRPWTRSMDPVGLRLRIPPGRGGADRNVKGRGPKKNEKQKGVRKIGTVSREGEKKVGKKKFMCLVDPVAEAGEKERARHVHCLNRQ